MSHTIVASAEISIYQYGPNIVLLLHLLSNIVEVMPQWSVNMCKKMCYLSQFSDVYTAWMCSIATNIGLKVAIVPSNMLKQKSHCPKHYA